MKTYIRVYTSVDMYGIGFLYQGKPALSHACLIMAKGRKKANPEAEFYLNDIMEQGE